VEESHAFKREDVGGCDVARRSRAAPQNRQIHGRDSEEFRRARKKCSLVRLRDEGPGEVPGPVQGRLFPVSLAGLYNRPSVSFTRHFTLFYFRFSLNSKGRQTELRQRERSPTRAKPNFLVGCNLTRKSGAR
jgi:hypothetical protein